MKTIFTEAARQALYEAAPVMVTVPSLLLYLKREKQRLNVGITSLKPTQRKQVEHTISVLDRMIETVEKYSKSGNHGSLTFHRP